MPVQMATSISTRVASTPLSIAWSAQDGLKVALVHLPVGVQVFAITALLKRASRCSKISAAPIPILIMRYVPCGGYCE